LTLLVIACDDGRPEPVAHLSLTLRVEPATFWGANPPYWITATATNDGDVPVLRFFCDCGYLTRILGPDAEPVVVSPSEFEASCVTVCVHTPIAPGESVTESYPFTGVLYESAGGEPIAAPPGTYTATATVIWSTSNGRGTGDHIETLQQTFDWPGP
jgi:hypothetical protein